MAIDIVPDDVKRLLKETYWIHKLETKFPSGLNTKLINNVEYEILGYAANPPSGRIALGRLRCVVEPTLSTLFRRFYPSVAVQTDSASILHKSIRPFFFEHNSINVCMRV